MSAARVIYFGSSAESARLLVDVLADKFCEVVAVVTRPEPRQGHRSQADTPVAKIASDAGLRLFRPQNPDEVIAEIKNLNVEAGLLFAYGKILSDELITAFPKGIVNVHPSLLPLHRGPSPIEATILDGDKQAGTTIMLIEKEMDAGPILQQVSFPVSPDISKSDLWEKLYTASLNALKEALPKYLNGSLTAQPQPSAGATYCKLIRKSDGLIDLTQESAQSLERKVRAFAGWPRVRIPVTVHDKATELTLHAVQLQESHKNVATPSIICEDGVARLALPDGDLRIESAQLAGRNIVSGRDLCNLPDLKIN